MTKKHFIQLADTIREHNQYVSGQGGINDSFNADTINVLANFCRNVNPRFNRERWLGYIAGTNGKNGGAIKKTL